MPHTRFQTECIVCALKTILPAGVALFCRGWRGMSQTSRRKGRREARDANLPQYTVGVVADRIGVPIATLRSWNQRYGVGPPDHSPGRHRLYSENDIAIVEQMQQLIDEGASPRSAARAALDSVVPPRADTHHLLAAALDMDAARAARQLEDHLRHYGVVDTWNELIRPVFSAIEVRQANGEGCVDVEHMLSWAVSRSLQRLPLTPQYESASIILASTEDETHTLALEALRAALGERGHGALMLGADVPTAALIDAIRRTGPPTTVMLWSQTDRTADIAMTKAVVAERARLLVGGPGWKSVRLPKKSVRLDSLETALQAIGDIG
jgi:MerR family transcriptional regulator, light-induced transcriptional regulator